MALTPLGWAHEGPSTPPPRLFEEETALSVALLNRHVRQWLEAGFDHPIWVCGELTGLTQAPSGHVYFTLKDAHAQVRCTLWKDRARRIGPLPRPGQRVRVLARVGLYEARGDYQLSVEDLQEDGVGTLFAQFVALKTRLEAEGLFDPARKRPLPTLPRGVALISSPGAAALADVLTALARRAPGLPVTLYPATVQGESAPRELIAALACAQARHTDDGCDVVLLVRGGGAPEDLQAFNDEALARAMASTALPIVTGIGHETDFTIADFVADCRAATPTAAAEHVSAGYFAARTRLDALRTRLFHLQTQTLHALGQRLDRLALRLSDPLLPIRQHRQNLTWAAQRLDRALATQHHSIRNRLQTLDPALNHALAMHHQHLRNRLTSLAHRLDALNPETVLAQGYARLRDAHGHPWPRGTVPTVGTHLQLELAQARVDVAVLSVRPC